MGEMEHTVKQTERAAMQHVVPFVGWIVLLSLLWFCGLEATTVVDMVSGAPEVIRVGKGDPSPFE